MSDFQRSNVREFTVSELSGVLKRTVEEQFGHVRVRAEISGLKRAASGHVYLALKDESAVLDGVMWKSMASKLTFRPEDGLEVVCTGKLTTYPGRSKYQIVIDGMAPAGVGALMALLEERKKKLAAEGLFAPERKKPLPYLPKTIGVVTSPTGAVIRDILHRLRDRFPSHVLLWPVLVQGDTAAEQVAAAVRGFNDLPENGEIEKPDLLIVARGGGSLEDLWAFNEEVVVRAVAESDIPVISAVGHETDTTLIDYVSDRRAPTPTAAAEMAVPVRNELLGYVEDLDRRIRRGLRRSIDDKKARLEGLSRGLRDPATLINEKFQHLDHLESRLTGRIENMMAMSAHKLAAAGVRLNPDILIRGIDVNLERIQSFDGRLARSSKVILERKRDQLGASSRLLESLSFRQTLKRGYAIVRDQEGKLLTEAGAVTAGTAGEVEFADGISRVMFAGEAAAVKPAKKPVKKKTETPEQGSLL